jgi:hypothetical protein
VTVAAFVGVLEQVPALQDALVGAAVGALLGNTVASRRERARPGAKAAPYILRWTWTGTGVGLVVHALAYVT